MNLTGVFINSGCVFLAGILGSLFKKSLSEKVKNTLMIGLGLCVLYIGISGISTDINTIILVLSVSFGAFIGELIDVNEKLNRFGHFLQNRCPVKNTHMADGFIASTLFVCVGAMSIVGGIESGTQGTYQVFLAKTFIDSIVVFIMSATKGVGCCLSAFVVLAYQTLITISAGGIAQVISDLAITQMSVVGSLVIVGIAFNLMNITKIKIGNYILCPFIPAVLGIGENMIKSVF